MPKDLEEKFKLYCESESLEVNQSQINVIKKLQDYFNQNFTSSLLKNLFKKTSVFYKSKRELDNLCGKDETAHQGLVAEVEQLEEITLKEFIIENTKDNKRIFIRWLILLPIKTNDKDNRIPIKKTDVTFKLVKLKPCKVDMIFQIDKIHVRKKDEMIKNIVKDLNFISSLSN